MPLTINVGLCKKVGQPDYGSVGASCSVEIELDQSARPNDLDDAFHERVSHAYRACRKAVEGELAAHHKSTAPRATDSHDTAHKQSGGQANGRNGLPASEKQLDYIRQLAGQIRGLGARRLETLANKMFDKSIGDLASLASEPS